MEDSTTQTPLLNGQMFHETCPGCIVARKKATSQGPPTKEFCIIAVIVLCNSLPISSLFPFLYFMVEDLGVAKEETSIGTYAGYIGSGYMFGRFLTSTPWGMFSDRFGRRPVILIGCAAIVIFNTLFGFSKVYWLVLTSRFMLGLFSGGFGQIRAFASEVCTEEHQALGLSLVGTMWGVGLIIGPAIGGYLARPSKQYPNIFPSGSFFDIYPYALPCVCISALASVGLFIGFMLPETVHNHKVEISHLKVENANSDNLSSKGHEPVIESLWKNWALVASISVYCVWSLHDMAYSEIFSLWAVSPVVYGGLGLTTAEVGNVLAVAGAGLLVFQFFIFPPLTKMFGPIQVARLPSLLTVPLTLIYPLFTGTSGAVMWIVLMVSAIVKNIFSACMVTGSFLMINNSVLTRQRGIANGVSMTFMSLFKAVGPACAGILFSWAQTRTDASFLPGMWLVFLLLSIVALLAFFTTFEPFLPSSLNKPIPENNIESTPEGEERLMRASSFTLE